MDNQNYSVAPHEYEYLAAAGVAAEKIIHNFDALDAFLQANQNWVFGHMSYGLGLGFHDIPSGPDPAGFPLFCFFVPEVVIRVQQQVLSIYAEDPESIYLELKAHKPFEGTGAAKVDIRNALSKEQYIELISAVQKHIHRGDCYELNFCMDFFSKGASIDPYAVFSRLMEISPNPFSVFYRNADSYLLCASPERFLSRKGDRIISQPIKGTIRRDREKVEADADLKKQLGQSEKDRAENVMVVDLVRNDFARICKEASVQVDELFGIYSYPQVHQMISTVSGTLRESVKFSEIIAATFPMGSMTGAPKHRVMQLIDQYENSTRGIFSGSVGYISPEGDFDFNVVIRSIMYNAAAQYLCYKVGSGITFYSQAEQEWEECLLKAEAIKKVLA